MKDFEREKSWLYWGLLTGFGFRGDLLTPSQCGDGNFYQETLWNEGIKYGQNFKKIVEILKGEIGTVEIPDELKKFWIQSNHSEISTSKKLRLVRKAYGSFSGSGNYVKDSSSPIGLVFETEQTQWETRTLESTLNAFLQSKEPQLLKDIIEKYKNNSIQNTVEKLQKEPSMPMMKDEMKSAVGVGTAEAKPEKKRYTISSIDARVLRIEAIKLIKYIVKSQVEERIPEESRKGFMKVVADILDRDIPDAVVLSLAAWLLETFGGVVIPDKFSGVVTAVSSEFKDEGKAIAKATGIDLALKFGGPMVMSLWGVVEKYIKEEPVEVGPEKQIEEGIDLNKMKNELEQEKVPVSRKKAVVA